jgi:hypothetical protein
MTGEIGFVYAATKLAPVVIKGAYTVMKMTITAENYVVEIAINPTACAVVITASVIVVKATEKVGAETISGCISLSAKVLWKSAEYLKRFDKTFLKVLKRLKAALEKTPLVEFAAALILFIAAVFTAPHHVPPVVEPTVVSSAFVSADIYAFNESPSLAVSEGWVD